MFAVSSTGWSPTLATLLLVMSTTLQPFLLPTVQASVVSGTVRQMWRPSMGSNSGPTKDRSTLATGRLGHSFSPDAQRCINSFGKQGSDANATCMAFQMFWLGPFRVINGNSSNDYKCKEMYCLHYCANLVGHSFCTADQSAALLKDLQDDFVRNAKLCKNSSDWIPPMDSPPQITSEAIKCSQTLETEDDVDKCVNEADMFTHGNYTTVDQLIELLCKTFFAEEKCNIDGVCKYCPSASKLLSLKAQFWTPASVECTKWSSDKPKFECPANIPTVGPVTPSLPAKTSSSPASACDLKAGEKVKQCEAEANKTFPDFMTNQEKRCKYVYNLADCSLKAACKYCTDSETKEPLNEARQTLDAIREGCKEWSSDEPKVECASSSTTTTSSSNTLMIVGIIIGVIILLVVIGVAVYCLCLAPDNSAPAGPSSNAAAGGGGSRASSKINSGKAGSTMGSKQQSRASSGAKQQSRIGAKQSSRA